MNEVVREPFMPRPNWQTRATFDDIVAWAASVAKGQWTWTRNGECKYVTLRIDTRSGAYRIEDRDGNEIGLADLRRQFGAQPPTKEPTP